MLQYALMSLMLEHGWILLNIPEYAWINYLTRPELTVCCNIVKNNES